MNSRGIKVLEEHMLRMGEAKEMWVLEEFMVGTGEG